LAEVAAGCQIGVGPGGPARALRNIIVRRGRRGTERRIAVARLIRIAGVVGQKCQLRIFPRREIVVASKVRVNGFTNRVPIQDATTVAGSRDIGRTKTIARDKR